MLRALYAKHRQLILYGIIGLSGATIDLLFYILFYKALSIPPGIASFMSVSTGIINNFILNSRHNFKVSDKLLSRFVNFYSIGVGGAILSAALILFLYDLFGVNPVIAKLLTIPPVVLLQFYLNRTYSFSDKHFDAPQTIKNLVVTNRAILGLNFIFLLVTLTLVKTIPFYAPPGYGTDHKLITTAVSLKGGPDEITHYTYNVDFILKNKRLPVSGKDDISAYKTCRVISHGTVPCLYSYVAYPGANYVANAYTAKIAHSIFGASFYVGARLASVVWGVIFLNCLFLLGRRLGKSSFIGLVTASAIAFIPQVLFIFSYTNQDAHSLAISAIVLLALTTLLQDRTRRSIILFAIAFGGLLPLVKFNFFILIPFIVGALLVGAAKRLFTKQQILLLISASVVAFLLIAGFWYARNLLLYHDLLGQHFMVHKMTEYGKPAQPYPLDLNTLQTFANNDFFKTLFQSFFVAYGYMQLFLSDGQYSVIQAGLLIALAAYAYIAVSADRRDRKILVAALGVFLIVLALAICLVFYNSAIYDYQAQGRYLFPVLPCLAVLLPLGYRLDRRNQIVAGILLVTTFYACFNTIGIFIRNYI
jgi:putative flippase GtrA